MTVMSCDKTQSLNIDDLQKKIRDTQYQRIGDTTMTICVITMQNGYTVLGKSACVDPLKYSQALGEKYAFEDALDKVWDLEGYLLKEKMYNESKT